mmetsp:Transcript_47402/g.120061  ORF Transcript_47402/g.120061 Transcript_47402/m.120061 type:complete len:82 (-) Transcript_47402:198-443(-)
MQPWSQVWNGTCSSAPHRSCDAFLSMDGPEQTRSLKHGVGGKTGACRVLRVVVLMCISAADLAQPRAPVPLEARLEGGSVL